MTHFRLAVVYGSLLLASGCDEQLDDSDTEFRTTKCVIHQLPTSGFKFKGNGTPNPEDPNGDGPWPEEFVVEFQNNVRSTAASALVGFHAANGGTKSCESVCADVDLHWIGTGCVNDFESNWEFGEIYVEGEGENGLPRLTVPVDAEVAMGCTCK